MPCKVPKPAREWCCVSERGRVMVRWCAILVLVMLVSVHSSAARKVPGDDHGGKNSPNEQSPERESASNSGPTEQTLVNAAAPKAADSPSGNGLDDRKNFIYGGVGGFAGVGGYAGLAGGLPLLGGLGGIGKYGGIGGAGGVGGYTGLGGLGGAGGLGGGTGGIGGLGGAGGGGAGAAGGGSGCGILPCP